MQDLKTFDEIKSQITKCDEVKKEIEIECVATINKAKSYARTAGLKEGQYWQQKRPQEEFRYRPPQNGRAEPGWQQKPPMHQTYQNRRQDKQERNTRTYNNHYRQNNYSNMETRSRRCWACREEGHIRAECPNVQCHHCKKRGHFKYQCYDAQPERRQQNKRFVAALEDTYEDSTKEDDPNEYAPTHGEMIGAIN